MPDSLRIEIFPSELQRSIEFYTNILQFTVIMYDGEYAFLRRGDIYIGAIEVPSSETIEEKASYRQPPKGIEIAFEVDDLDKERDFVVDKGWNLKADIETQPWGLRDFRIVDPDGYYLRITTHSPWRDGKASAKI